MKSPSSFFPISYSLSLSVFLLISRSQHDPTQDQAWCRSACTTQGIRGSPCTLRQDEEDGHSRCPQVCPEFLHFASPRPFFLFLLLFCMDAEISFLLSIDRVLRLQPGHKYCLLGRLSSEVGWNYYDIIKVGISPSLFLFILHSLFIFFFSFFFFFLLLISMSAVKWLICVN